jgi:hypothetical protein
MERVKTFVNGGREYPADLNAIQDRAAEMLEGTEAELPGSHFAGRFFRANDTGKLFLDNGTIWESLSLLVKTHSTETTAKGGELVEMTAAGTVNLPKAAAANTTIGVFALGGEVTVKTTSAEHINGDFLAEAATSCKLTKFQHVVVQYDGTRWLIVAGQPANENASAAQVSRAEKTLFEPSATRPTEVAFTIAAPNEGSPVAFEIFRGGVLIIGPVLIPKGTPSGNASTAVTFLCPPKVKWEYITPGAGAYIAKSSYLTL